MIKEIKFKEIKFKEIKIGDISYWPNTSSLFFLITKIKYNKNKILLTIDFFCLKEIKIYTSTYYGNNNIKIIDIKNL